jgi:hypothetical protein
MFIQSATTLLVIETNKTLSEVINSEKSLIIWEFVVTLYFLLLRSYINNDPK